MDRLQLNNKEYPFGIFFCPNTSTEPYFFFSREIWTHSITKTNIVWNPFIFFPLLSHHHCYFFFFFFLVRYFFVDLSKFLAF